MLASVPIAHLQCCSQSKFTRICSFFSQIHDFPLRTAAPSVCHHWCPVMSPRDPGISLDPSFYFSSYMPLFISFFFFSSLCSFLKKKKKNWVPTKDFALCLLLDIVWRMNQSLEFILKLKGHPQIYNFKLWYLWQRKRTGSGREKNGMGMGPAHSVSGPRKASLRRQH